MKLLNKDIFAVFLSLAVTAACGYLLYLDIYVLAKGSGISVGTITFKKKVAQRRLAGNSIWDDLAQKTDVFNYDSVRTEEDSGAVVTFNDGTRIDIDSNSMVVIYKKGDEIGIDVSGGNISASRGKSDLLLKTGGAVFKVNSGTLSIEKKDSGVSANVENGTADVVSASGTETFSPEKQLLVGAAGVSSSRIEINAKTPQNGASIITGNSFADVDFEWEGAPEGTVELSKKKDFSVIAASASSTGKTVLKIQPGMYYWRVSAKSAKSGIKKLYVFADNPLTPVFPANDGEVVQSRADTPVILKWKGADAAQGYIVKFSSDPEMTDSAEELRTQNRFAGIRLEKPGRYYWKVKALYGGSFSESKTLTFMYGGVRDAPPVLTVPFEDASLSVLSAAGGKTRFAWKRNTADNYRIEISPDTDFVDVIYSAETNQSGINAVMPDIKPGKYYWRVAGLKSASGSNSLSGLRSFTVRDTFPVVIFHPAAGNVVSRGLQTFRWADRNNGSFYKIEIASDADFKKIVHTSTVSEKTARVDIQAGGVYHWRVSLLNSSSEAISTSSVSQFRIPSSLEKVKIISPASDYAFDMNLSMKVRFDWTRSVSADLYSVNIKQTSAGLNKSVYSGKVRTNFLMYSLPPDVKPGRYRFEVKALKTERGVTVSESEESIVNFNLERGETLSAPVIINPGVIYVK